MSTQSRSTKSSAARLEGDNGRVVTWDEPGLIFEEPIEITEPPTELGSVLKAIEHHPGKWVRVKNYPTYRGARSIAGRLSNNIGLGRTGKNAYPGFDPSYWDFEVRPINEAGDQQHDGKGGALFARYHEEGS